MLAALLIAVLVLAFALAAGVAFRAWQRRGMKVREKAHILRRVADLEEQRRHAPESGVRRPSG